MARPLITIDEAMALVTAPMPYVEFVALLDENNIQARSVIPHARKGNVVVMFNEYDPETGRATPMVRPATDEDRAARQPLAPTPPANP